MEYTCKCILNAGVRAVLEVYVCTLELICHIRLLGRDNFLQLEAVQLKEGAMVVSPTPCQE